MKKVVWWWWNEQSETYTIEASENGGRKNGEVKKKKLAFRFLESIRGDFHARQRANYRNGSNDPLQSFWLLHLLPSAIVLSVFFYGARPYSVLVFLSLSLRIFFCALKSSSINYDFSRFRIVGDSATGCGCHRRKVDGFIEGHKSSALCLPPHFQCPLIQWKFVMSQNFLLSSRYVNRHQKK